VPDHKATAEELRTELERARVKELDTRATFMRAVVYRVRMQVRLELAVERELTEKVWSTS